MLEIYINVLNIIAEIIGFIGVIIIFIGILMASYYFLVKKKFFEIRLILVKHILLGLDFLIAKDIIETVILPDNKIWTDVAVLLLIVVIRVTFSYFTSKELEEIIDIKNHSNR